MADVEIARSRDDVPTHMAARFYYETHLFTDREGKLHFTFEVPNALGQGRPFTRYSRPETDEAAYAALDAAIVACEAILNERAVPYTLEPKYVD